jgi:tRNA pseudouridine55 synthase
LVDKPIGFSSFQIVRALQKRYRKIGHAGTLDPFASGLLIILTDKDTKMFRRYETCEKEYHGEMLLGIVTDTYDISGRVVAKDGSILRPTNSILDRITREFTGSIKQAPPSFSALKSRGRKLYELSRKGIDIKPPVRTVTVMSFSIVHYDYPIVGFIVVVGKGVYIRSLAHDFGARLGTGATLLSLRRQRIGDCTVARAVTLGTLLNSAGD